MKAHGAKVVVVGNEKGGSGKTTVALHLAIGLMGRGMAVGSVDLDSHQQSLSRAIDNRRAWSEENGVDLSIPRHRLVESSVQDSRSVALRQDRQHLDDVLASLSEDCRIVVVDCPAGQGSLARAAHEVADVLVTPLNDSFIDLDVLLQFRAGTFEPAALGGYARMIWEAREERRRSGQNGLDWIVLRNRLSGLIDQNKKDLERLLEKIAPAMGFHLAPGLGERVIFRRLFPLGLTIFDSDEPKTALSGSRSLRAARQDIDDLIEALRGHLDIVDDAVLA